LTLFQCRISHVTTDVTLKIISKLFQCFISHATTSDAEIKSFQSLKLFQNYFSATEHVRKYSQAAISF